VRQGTDQSNRDQLVWRRGHIRHIRPREAAEPYGQACPHSVPLPRCLHRATDFVGHGRQSRVAFQSGPGRLGLEADAPADVLGVLVQPALPQCGHEVLLNVVQAWRGPRPYGRPERSDHDIRPLPDVAAMEGSDPCSRHLRLHHNYYHLQLGDLAHQVRGHPTKTHG